MHEKLHTFELNVHSKALHIAQAVIDSIRKINQKDPEFCHTCMCKNDITSWKFAYSDQQNYIDAYLAYKDKIRAIKLQKPNVGETTGTSDIMPTASDACVCPLA